MTLAATPLPVAETPAPAARRDPLPVAETPLEPLAPTSCPVAEPPRPRWHASSLDGPQASRAPLEAVRRAPRGAAAC